MVQKLLQRQDHIFDAFENQKIEIVNGKKYCINTITDHSPVTDPKLIKQIIKEMSSKVEYKKADILVGEEDRGGYLCSLLAYAWNKPFTMTKWNPTGLDGDIKMKFTNAYTSGNLYLNGIEKLSGKKVVIVEDLIDTGGTIIAMVQLLRQNGIEVVEVVAVAEKADYKGLERIQKEIGLKPKVLVTFKSGKQKSKVIKRHT